MKLFSETVPNLRLAYDNTTLSKFVECPRKYQLAMLLHIKPAKPSIALSFGNCVHAALEHADKFLIESEELALKHQYNRVNYIYDVIKWTLAYTHKNYPDVVWSDDKYRNIYTLLRTVVWYIDYYKDSTTAPVRLPDGKAALELSFSFELPYTAPSGEALLYCGHIDGIFENHNGVPVVIDRKTTKSGISDKFFNNFLNSSQMTGYAVGAHLNFDIDIKGVIIDGISNQVNATEFSRREVPITPARAEEFLHDCGYWLDFLMKCTEADYFPMNRTSCHNYGGCEYLDFCRRCPSVRKNFLDGAYVVGEVWNPLESR